MKLNLEGLKYLYDYKKEELKEEDINSFEEFKDYILSTIISNIEYDLGIEFSDYVDLNNFIENKEVSENE